MFEQLLLPEQAGIGHPHRRGDPTPEEIRAMCQEIQAEWSPTEERARRYGYGFLTGREGAVTTWQPPVMDPIPPADDLQSPAIGTPHRGVSVFIGPNARCNT